MWIMLNNAFISIVNKDCAPDELMVRARRPGDIEKLFPETEGKVTPFTGSDYHYRAALPRTRIALMLCEQIGDISYSNFKDSVKDRPLHDAYLRVWHAMSYLQPEAPYAGRSRRSPVFDRLSSYEDLHLSVTGHMPDGTDIPPRIIKARKRSPKNNIRGR